MPRATTSADLCCEHNQHHFTWHCQKDVPRLLRLDGRSTTTCSLISPLLGSCTHASRSRKIAEQWHRKLVIVCCEGGLRTLYNILNHIKHVLSHF